MPKNPKPFSSEWLQDPAPRGHRPRRVHLSANHDVLSWASRLPSERKSNLIVVLMFVLGSFWFAAPGNGQSTDPDPTPVQEVESVPRSDVNLELDDVEQPSAPTISTDNLTVVEGKATEQVVLTPPSFNLEQAQTQNQTLTPDGLLPANRILTFYGFPENPDMGILGEYAIEDLLARLREQAAEYEQIDPTRPVLVAMEVIASVAQRTPQADGSYLIDTDSSWLDMYTDFARENDILLILDVQVGYRGVQADVESLRPWLVEPFVHLAIDPEFAMHDGEIPGDAFGHVDGSDVTWAQHYLAELTAAEGIPPKVLIVHQFLESMIENKDTIEVVAGVQLVIDSDGWGPPAEKETTYGVTNTSTPIEFNGVKLFYRQDFPIMTPEEVLELDPIPDLIIYQ